jgi:hypothetical protein
MCCSAGTTGDAEGCCCHTRGLRTAVLAAEPVNNRPVTGEC